MKLCRFNDDRLGVVVREGSGHLIQGGDAEGIGDQSGLGVTPENKWRNRSNGYGCRRESRGFMADIIGGMYSYLDPARASDFAMDPEQMLSLADTFVASLRKDLQTLPQVLADQDLVDLDLADLVLEIILLVLLLAVGHVHHDLITDRVDRDLIADQ